MFYKVILLNFYLCFFSVINSVDEDKRIDSYLMHLINNQQWSNDIDIEYTIHFYLYLYRVFFSLTEKKWDDHVDIVYLDDKDPFVCLPFLKVFNKKEYNSIYYFKRYDKNIAPSNLPESLISQLYIEKTNSDQSSENNLTWCYNELLYLFYLNFVHICLQCKFFLICKNLKIDFSYDYQKNNNKLEVSEYVANISVLRLLLFKETAENFIINNLKGNTYDLNQLYGSEKKIIEIANKAERTREDYVMFAYSYIDYLNREIIENFKKKILQLNKTDVLKKKNSYFSVNEKLFNRKIKNNESLDSIIIDVLDELKISEELPAVNLLKNTSMPFTKLVKGLDNMINDKVFFDDNSFFLYKFFLYTSFRSGLNFKLFSFKKLLVGMSTKIDFEDFNFFLDLSLFFRIQFPDLISDYIKYFYVYIFKLCEKKINTYNLLNLTFLINIGNINLFKFANLVGLNLGLNIYRYNNKFFSLKFVFEVSLLN